MKEHFVPSKYAKFKQIIMKTTRVTGETVGVILPKITKISNFELNITPERGKI